MGEMLRLSVLQRVLHVVTTGLSTDTNYKGNFSDAMAQALIYRRVTLEVGCRSQATPNWDLWCIKSHRTDLFPSISVSSVASFIFHQLCTILAMTEWLVTRTFVISIKSNKEGTGFVEDLLRKKTPVLKYVCYVQEHYSVTAGVLKYEYMPIWRSVCISV